MAKGCDLLIHMCSYITGSVENRATQLGTSGHLQAARAAAAAGARRLVATHIYDQFDQPGIREKVIAEMSRVYDGVIVIGEDLMQLSLEPETVGIFR
jgi:ribonuclease Z